MSEKLYAQRDDEKLDEFIFKHRAAMTAEDLHSKSAIAGELGYRDAKIAELEEALRWRDKSEAPADGQLILMIGYGWRQIIYCSDVALCQELINDCEYWLPIQLPEAK